MKRAVVMSSVCRLAWVAALLCATSRAAWAADEPSVLRVAAEEAELRLYNRPITTLRARLFGVPPATRARRAEERLHELLETAGPITVSVHHEPQGDAVLVNGSLAWALTPDDADPLLGETLTHATERAVANLRLVAAENQEAHNRSRVLRAATRTGLATLAFVLAAWLVFRTRRWLVIRMARLLEQKTEHVQVAGAKLIQSTRLFGVSRWVVRTFTTVLLAALVYRFASFALSQFPYSRPLGEELDGALLGLVSTLATSMVRALPGVLMAVAIFWLARGLVGALKPFFTAVEHGTSGAWLLDPDTARASRRIVSAVVWLVAAVMAYPYLPGSDSQAFKGVSVLVGLMVTLGGSSLFGQAASGLILLYSRTLRIGDYVRIGEHEGTAIELGVFTTKLRTGLGEVVTIPNALALSAVTRNYSRPSSGSGFVLDTVVTIGYDAPWRQVNAMLLEAALRTPGVLGERAPEVFQTALSDYYVEYRLVCQAKQTGPRARAEAKSALNANVQDVFNEYGVQIMSPHYLVDPTKPKVVPQSAWYAAPASKPTAGETTEK